MAEGKAEYLSDADELMGWNEPKQIITEISGYTMIFDCVLERYKNLVKASVHGAVYRHCHFKDGVCKASLKTIGEMIGVDKATVMRYVKELCDDGYFKDLTPNLRNKPHIYADTGVVQIKNKFSVAYNNATVAQNNTSVAQCNATVAQDQLTKVKKIDSKIDSEEAKKRIAKQREKRGTFVDAYRELSQAPGTKKQIRLEGIQSRIAVCLNINVTWSRWERFIRHADKQEQASGETVEKFLSWLKSKPGFDISYWPPDKMIEVWPQAFETFSTQPQLSEAELEKEREKARLHFAQFQKKIENANI